METLRDDDGWLESGDDLIFRGLHLPAGRARDLRVVLCGPMGWDATSAHRPLRAFADTLAGRGYATTWFSWPGAGDSSGDDARPDMFERWRRAVVSLAAELERVTGAERLALIGVRAGGFAACAAAVPSDACALATWALPASGRYYLRELRAEEAAGRTGERPPGTAAPATGSVESFGYLLAPETAATLEATTIGSLLAAARLEHALVLPRDGLRVPAAVTDALRASGAVVETAEPKGYPAMMAEAHTSQPATAVFATTADWLDRISGPGGEPRPTAHPDTRRRVPIDGVSEELVHFVGGDGVALRGVVTQATGRPASDRRWVVFLNAGAVPRVGPNRLWTRFARRLARDGMPSLRFDAAGVGDSGGTSPSGDLDALYHANRSADIEAALEHLRDHFGARSFVLVGLCSGALLAFTTIVAVDEVETAVMINPVTLVWSTGRTVTSARSREWFTRTPMRLRLLQVLRAGRALTRRVRRVSPPMAATTPIAKAADPVLLDARRALARGARLAFVFADGDPGRSALEQHFGPDYAAAASEPGFSAEIVAGADHTFTGCWSHPILEQIVVAAAGQAARSANNRS